jgi:hypothetical protein
MLETGRHATIKEIAKAEKINPSFVSRVLRLTLLLQRLATLMSLFPLSWPAQLSIFEVHPMGREDGNR